MNLSLRSYERHEAIIGRDFKVGTHARSSKLVERLDRWHHGHDLTRVHVIVVKVLVTRAENNLIAGQLGKMSGKNRELVKEYRLNFGVLFAINLNSNNKH
jgi:hypothetical protein